MCWLRSKIRVLVRHPSAELVTSHGEEGTIQVSHNFGLPNKLGAWAGVCNSARLQAKECRSAGEMSIAGLEAFRHLQSCSEMYVKQFFEILWGIKKSEEGKDIYRTKQPQMKNSIFTLRKLIRKCELLIQTSSQCSNLSVTTAIGGALQGGHFLQSLPSCCPTNRSHGTGMLEGAPWPAPLLIYGWNCCPWICLALCWTWWYSLPQKPSLATDSRSSSMLFWCSWIKIQEHHLQTQTSTCRHWVLGLPLQSLVWCLMPSELPSGYGCKGHWIPSKLLCRGCQPCSGVCNPTWHHASTMWATQLRPSAADAKDPNAAHPLVWLARLLCGLQWPYLYGLLGNLKYQLHGVDL